MQKLLTKNKRAFYDFEVLERFEAGMVLHGYEVKSLKLGRGSFNGTFVTIQNGEAFIEHLHIPLYDKTTMENYEPETRRKLLLNKTELIKIGSALNTKGMTIVPLAIGLTGGRVKMEIAMVRGKKLYDKRESIKKRDVKRHIETSLKDY
ncbi:MAG: SsrA-binding protein SmpB [Candidatus Gracilibacteria bacterium]